jgi:uncharacterized protein YbjQ (UPF0145 family)
MTLNTMSDLGADAILAIRSDVSDLGHIGQEICACGAAVKIRRAG